MSNSKVWLELGRLGKGTIILREVTRQRKRTSNLWGQQTVGRQIHGKLMVERLASQVCYVESLCHLNTGKGLKLSGRINSCPW